MRSFPFDAKSFPCRVSCYTLDQCSTFIELLFSTPKASVARIFTDVIDAFSEKNNEAMDDHLSQDIEAAETNSHRAVGKLMRTLHRNEPHGNSNH